MNFYFSDFLLTQYDIICYIFDTRKIVLELLSAYLKYTHSISVINFSVEKYAHFTISEKDHLYRSLLNIH